MRGAATGVHGVEGSAISGGASDVAASGSATSDRSPEADGRALAAALGDRDPIRRTARIADILTNLSPENVGAVLAAFEAGPRNDETRSHFREFLYAWGRMSAEEAMAYVLDSDSEFSGTRERISAISGWAASDIEGARSYVDTVADAGAKQWMRYGVMQEMLYSDLQGAIVYAEENDKSHARGRQLAKLAQAISEQRGVAGLEEWVAGIDHDSGGNDLLSYKKYAVGITLDKIAAADPQAAADWIGEHAGQPYLTAAGLERAARGAAGPIDAELDWLAGLPAVEGQGRAIGERFEDFIRSDFTGAGEWLAAQALGANFDEAIEDYARSAARDDREAALAWAERISDPQLRAKTVERITTPRRG